MSLLLAIDPGVVTPGAAIFDIDSLQLVEARYFKGPGFKSRPWALTEVAEGMHYWVSKIGDVASFVSEWPQIYGGRRSGGRKDPNDMLPLAGMVGALLATLVQRGDIMPGAPSAAFVLPHEWKGSKQKNPTARMVLDRLAPSERLMVAEILPFERALEAAGEKECKHPTMNAIDAVGIGLHHLGRLQRRRIIAR